MIVILFLYGSSLRIRRVILNTLSKLKLKAQCLHNTHCFSDNINIVSILVNYDERSCDESIKVNKPQQLDPQLSYMY